MNKPLIQAVKAMKRAIFDMAVPLIPWQGEVMADFFPREGPPRARFGWVNAGRGSRKTDLLKKWLCLATLNSRFRGEGFFTARTAKSARELAWDLTLDFLRNQPRTILTGDPNKADLVIPILDGRRICFKGLDKPDAVRGGHPVAVACDEFAICPPKSWHTAIRLAIADKESPVLGGTTPRGKNQFYDLCKVAGYDDATEKYNPKLATPGWKYYHYTSYEAGNTPPWELDDLKNGPNRMTEAEFNQEIMARFLGYTGTLVGHFTNRLWDTEGGNIVSYKWWMERMEIYRKKTNLMFFRVIDWAIGGTTVCIWVAVDQEGRKIVFDEYSCTGKTVPMIADAIKARHKDLPITLTILDKSMFNKGTDERGNSLAEQFARNGIMGRMSDSRFDESISMLNTLCVSPDGDRMPLLVFVEGVCRLCTSQLDTIYIQFPERNGSDKIGKQECDALDCVRYAAMLGVLSMGGGEVRTTEKAPDDENKWAPVVREAWVANARAVRGLQPVETDETAGIVGETDGNEQKLDPLTGVPKVR